MTLKIATWNVNSIKARLEHVKKWITTNNPDLLMLQELKGLDFPTGEFEAMGYNAQAVTQKAYNGVATLSKQPQEVILNELPSYGIDNTDEQARYLEIQYNDLRIINIYLPNGNPVDTNSDKFPYKIKWMKRLHKRLSQLREAQIPFVIGGDFNVIPEEQDCYDPKAWAGDALFHPDTHKQWQSLLNLGVYDAFRIKNKSKGQYSFWDYQRGAWQKDHGIRIDHFLLSPPTVDALESCVIDKTPRGEEKASDHTPVILELNKLH
jgi:exodeoxyribonuclease-3